MDENIADLMKMDNAVEKFVEQYADSFIKWEVVQFYYEHPKTWFKIEELAKSLNRSLKPLKKELQELRERGFLHEERSGKAFSYRFDPDETPAGQELKDTLDRFIKICQEREGRLRVIYKLLKDGKPIQG